MPNSPTSIIDHIPLFSDYCAEIGLSTKTQENYNRYLKKLIAWLLKNNKESLLPHELSPADIDDYKLYLSNFQDEKGHTLKKVTQHYYLIALRALLSYFTAKDIISLPADKISLPKDAKKEKTVKFLNLEQIERLLEAPKTNNPTSLRDKAILKVLISTGLKINQLKNFNRKTIEQFIPGEALPWVNKYLDIRDDNDIALFINYRSRKGAGRRLTARSIERIVNYYGRKTNLPFLITPEILRWSRALALLDKEIEIQKPYPHRSFTIEKYKINKSKLSIPHSRLEKINNLFPSWSIVEKIIKNETSWLKDNIQTLPERYKQNPIFLKCDDCILRKIAILIASGEIDAFELKAMQNNDLWDGFTKKIAINRISRHGEEWHRKMMNGIFKYFKLQNYKVDIEPILDYGRADIGAYSNKNNTIYIEIGTVSLFKLWYNLSTMKNTTFLIVSEEDYAIEFKT